MTTFKNLLVPYFINLISSMKFKVSSNDLLKKLQIAAGAIGSNPVLPILEDFLFSVEGQNLTIAATDLETTISTMLELVESESDGKCGNPR